jgi:hypothetical protein
MGIYGLINVIRLFLQMKFAAREIVSTWGLDLLRKKPRTECFGSLAYNLSRASRFFIGVPSVLGCYLVSLMYMYIHVYLLFCGVWYL